MSMTKGITAPITAIGALSTKIGMEFEDSMQKSISIMGDVSDSMRNNMGEAAREVAMTTDKSAKQAADSYFYLASAGMDAKESIKALPKVANFATAGQFKMSEATDLLTDAQSALGLTVDDTAQNMKNMQRVSDVLVKANTEANASVQQFSEALTNKAGAALKTVNKDIEEGSAVLAVLADQGIKGQKAGNELSRTLRYMKKAALENKEALKKHNVEIFDGNGNMRNMAAITKDLEVALKGMSDQEKAATLKAMGFNAETQGTIMKLMGSSEQMKKYIQSEFFDEKPTPEQKLRNERKTKLKKLGVI